MTSVELFHERHQHLSLRRPHHKIEVNYRGSSGYSKTFLHKGDKQWGIGSMQHDLSDAMKWAIEEGIALELYPQSWCDSSPELGSDVLLGDSRCRQI